MRTRKTMEELNTAQKYQNGFDKSVAVLTAFQMLEQTLMSEIYEDEAVGHVVVIDKRKLDKAIQDFKITLRSKCELPTKCRTAKFVKYLDRMFNELGYTEQFNKTTE